MRLGFIAATALAIATNLAGCSGGCYDQAGPVSVSPEASCLTLFGGQSATDPGVCGAPDLGGTNACAQALTLPSPLAGGAPRVFQPGAKIVYALPAAAAPPGITVTKRGDLSDYTVVGSLGTDSVTITFTVRPD